MSLTRRAAARPRRASRRPGSAPAARSPRSGSACSTRRRRSTAPTSPSRGSSAVAVLRAASYDGDLEGLLLDGLRLVEPDVRGRSVLLKPNLVEYAAGSSINTDPRLVVAAANTLRRMGAASVVVAEGPGHRRDTEAVMLASGMQEALADAGVPFVDLNDAPLVRTPLRTSYTGLRELWVPRVLRETERRRLDAEAQDAPLGRRHDVAEELLRLHAGPRLRLAEGRLPRPRDPGVHPRHRRRGAPVARDHRRHRRHGGGRPDHGRPGRRRASSSSRATSWRPTSPGRG